MSQFTTLQRPTSTKTRSKKSRTVRVLIARPRGEENFVEITESGPRSSKSMHYWVKVIPSAWGFAMQWSKPQADGGEVYEANIGGTGGVIAESDDGEKILDEGPTGCPCLESAAHGHCKHVEATRALLAAGKL